MRSRMWMLVAVVAVMLMVGAGVAYATGSSEASSGQAGGANIEKASSVALDHVNGRVTDTEVEDEEGYYEIEVTKDDGSQVDVHLDRNFEVLGTLADHEDSENQDAPDDGGDDSGE